MAQNKTEKKSSHSLIKKSALIIIGLFLLYVIAGFWVVPPLLKPRLEELLSDQISRKVTIETIKINPLILSFTIINLTVYEPDEQPFAGFKELLVDAELSSLVRWAMVFKQIRVLAPFGMLRILPDQTLNISDIITKFNQNGPQTEEPAELPRAVVSKLQVKNGKFAVQDLTAAEPITETFAPITFTLTNLSSLPERKGTFKFTGIGPNGGHYQLDGQIFLNPIRVQGSYSTTGTKLHTLWKHIQDQVAFQIRTGTAATSGNYLLELIAGTLHAKVHNGLFELKDFQLTEKGKDKVLISIPSFSVRGISADVDARKIVVEQVKTDGARIESWIASDGTFNLPSLFRPALQKSKEKEKSDSTEPKTPASSPWHALIHKIEVNNWGAAIEDRTLPKPARITIDDFTVNIENLENRKNSKAQITLAFQINKAGTVKMNGIAGIDPLSADIKVFADKIALKSFQPYVDTALNAQIASGTTSSKGRILYHGKEGQPQFSYQAELSLDGVTVNDRIRNEDFISLKQLKISGIVFNVQPNKLNVANILINKAHARITIDQNRKINVVQAFEPVGKPADQKDEKGQQNLIERLVNFLILQIKGPMPMHIDLVKLDNFTVAFIDDSIRPPYKTLLEITQATMKGLSSNPSARADFKIEGSINQSATISSAGQMNPLNALQYAKVDFLLKDFKLNPLSPYSGKYAGYKIAQGTLSLDIKFRVADHKYTGDNKIIVDQLTLGDRVDSPDATNLPVKLGVALLKGPDGRITLQVPVAGNIKDPHFKFGQGITGSLTEVMDTVRNSPFAAIPPIDGFKGEELRFVAFESGSVKLSGQERKKLNALAKFLNAKPVLTLGIEGSADRRLDWAQMSGKHPRKAEPASKQKEAKAPEKDLPEDQAAEDDQLKKLARMRANLVKDYLIQKGKVAASRIQVKPAKIISTTDKEYGQVELFLSAQ